MHGATKMVTNVFSYLRGIINHSRLKQTYSVSQQLFPTFRWYHELGIDSKKSNVLSPNREF